MIGVFSMFFNDTTKSTFSSIKNFKKESLSAGFIQGIKYTNGIYVCYHFRNNSRHLLVEVWMLCHSCYGNYHLLRRKFSVSVVQSFSLNCIKTKLMILMHCFLQHWSGGNRESNYNVFCHKSTGFQKLGCIQFHGSFWWHLPPMSQSSFNLI